jgi:hypothetical protein
MYRRITLTLCLAVACSLAASSSAQAQYGQGCGGYGGYGMFDAGRLYRVLAQNVPHFAAFPPVYYSAPVARTYGYSPFAYPPGVMTPEIVDAAPQEIMNPHIESVPTPPATSDASSDQTTQVESATAPLAIFNPYVGKDRLTSLPSSSLGR